MRVTPELDWVVRGLNDRARLLPAVLSSLETAVDGWALTGLAAVSSYTELLLAAGIDVAVIESSFVDHLPLPADTRVARADGVAYVTHPGSGVRWRFWDTPGPELQTAHHREFLGLAARVVSPRSAARFMEARAQTADAIERNYAITGLLQLAEAFPELLQGLSPEIQHLASNGVPLDATSPSPAAAGEGAGG